MSKDTFERRKAALEEKHQEALKKLQIEEDILSALPDNLPKDPTITFIEPCTNTKAEGARIMFSDFMGRLGFVGSEILEGLESIGFTSLPCSVAKYGQYTPSAYLGMAGNLPKTYSRGELKSAEGIAPLFIELDGYSNMATAFYEGPDDKTYRVSVPAKGFHVHAARIEFPGGWRYDRNRVSVQVPNSLKEGLHVGDEVFNKHPLSKGVSYTDQIVRGRVYLTSPTYQDEIQATPAEILKALEG